VSELIDDGGPAFPIVVPGHVYKDGSSTPPEVSDEGMKLRDYFAIKALHAEIVAQNGLEGSDSDQVLHFARMAYQIADAMIEARKAKS
jgi:hypothetical protein